MKGSDGAVRPAYGELSRWLDEVPPDVLDFRRREAELLLPPHRHHLRGLWRGRRAGAPDPLRRHAAHPRRRRVGDRCSAGSSSASRRSTPISSDVYGRREILRAGIVPEDLVFQNPVFRPEMNGQKVPHDIYVHIAGIDIVRVDAETSTCSKTMPARPPASPTCWRTARSCCGCFPELFSRHRIAPVENYPDELLATLKSVAPPTASRSDGGAAHARHLQFGLLRALVPRRQARRRAGRRPRSVRPRTTSSTCARPRARSASM